MLAMLVGVQAQTTLPNGDFELWSYGKPVGWTPGLYGNLTVSSYLNIPVEVTGREESLGIKDGGVLEVTHELEVLSLPMSIPDVITVDVSALNVGDAIHAGDIKLPEGVELVVDPDEVVAIVVTSRGVEDAAPEEEETAAADVEVVAKGKAAKEDESAEEKK